MLLLLLLLLRGHPPGGVDAWSRRHHSHTTGEIKLITRPRQGSPEKRGGGEGEGTRNPTPGAGQPRQNTQDQATSLKEGKGDKKKQEKKEQKNQQKKDKEEGTGGGYRGMDELGGRYKYQSSPLHLDMNATHIFSNRVSQSIT